MCFNRKQKLTNKYQIIIKITITNSSEKVQTASQIHVQVPVFVCNT